MNYPLAFCQPNTGLSLVALGSLAAQESIEKRKAGSREEIVRD